MHVWYELEDKLITEKHAGIEAMLKKHESEVEVKKAAVREHERRVKEARAELRELEDAAARFGLFLRVNSITPYNDEMLAYLDDQIKEERQIVNSTRAGQDRLDGLLRTRAEYEQQIRVLEKEMSAGGAGGAGKKKPLDERDVEKLVLRLYRLKGWGQSLRDIKTAAEYYGGGGTYHERQFRSRRTWQHGGWSRSSYSSSSSPSLSLSLSATLVSPSRGFGHDRIGSGSSSGSGSGGGYTLTAGPQKYSSLLPPEYDDSNTGEQAAESEWRPRSLVPEMSMRSAPVREVEPVSISSRLKSGLFGRLRKSSK